MANNLLAARTSDDLVSAKSSITITPDTPFPTCRGVYVGTAGSLVVTYPDGTTDTFTTAVAGYHPLQITNVAAASTATDLHALY